jgi:mannose-6-phosphate isomerase class I
MFNPHPFDDPNVVNRPELPAGIADEIVPGTKETAGYLAGMLVEKVRRESRKNGFVLAMDGYIGAQWQQVVNLITQELKNKALHVVCFDFSQSFKTSGELDVMFAGNLDVDKGKDPVSLFGKLFKGNYEDLFDKQKADALRENIVQSVEKEGVVVIVYGNGCASSSFRALYDCVVYFDVTPKRVILRARNGCFANLGDRTARPLKEMLRRCYYIDFEVAGRLRGELLQQDAIDFYIAGDDPDRLILIPRTTFHVLTGTLATYPFRCKPVYLEGVWGGHYVIKQRGITGMRNCAWVFDLIPLEVSIVIQAGATLIEIPFFTFVQQQGEAIMGKECMEKFGGYFPIRFNYDDTFHSSGNMSIQVHSGHDYNVSNYNEHGRQDESYYVVATGHEAKTYIGFNEDADPEAFIAEARKSEKEHTAIDYRKYVNHIESRPGVQLMLPAGTIHASGRNQLILEIGSLTIGSYTYKMYDYLRADFDGKPRPIHTWHGNNVLRRERSTSWVNKNLIQAPRPVRKGDGWAEYIAGEHELLYFSLRRLEFEREMEDDTCGVFHVLSLVDGEKVLIQSTDHPERCYIQHYLDVVVVPASTGRYVIKNLGNQPVYMHKTLLKEGFAHDNG